MSVLSCFSKFVEKKRLAQLIECAIVDFVVKITQAIEQGKFSLSWYIFWIYQKLSIQLITRFLLEHWYKSSVTKHWFENYSSNRNQIVKYIIME